MTDYGTFADYLATHEESAGLCDQIRRAITAIGPAVEKTTRSQLAFLRRRTFAWVWAPGQYLKGNVAPLVLTLDFPQHDPSPRWKEVVEPRPGLFTHHLELHAPGDIDSEVMNWLRAAWESAG
jgi:hypothetical protein